MEETKVTGVIICSKPKSDGTNFMRILFYVWLI
jgi:hypothetical protein